MRKTSVSAFAATIFVLVSSRTLADEIEKPCREHPQIVGACFEVHGRLAIYNGSPGFRLWPVGTKRLLGVSEYKHALTGYSNIPESIAKLFVTTDTAVYGDFMVCPFAKQQPDVMQFICIDSGKNFVIREWTGE